MKTLRNRPFWFFVVTALAVLGIYETWRQSNGIDHIKSPSVEELRKNATSSGDMQSFQAVAYSPATQLQLIVQLGHFAVSAAFSPNGHLIATGGTDNTARLWETAAGREIRRFAGHGGTIHTIAFSPDGRLLLTGSSDTTARLWEVVNGHEMHRFQNHSAPVRAVAFSPDGDFVATAGTDKENSDPSVQLQSTLEPVLHLWDAATGQEIRSFIGHTLGVSSVTFSPNGQLALTGSWDGTVRTWEVATGREVRLLEGQGAAVAFSPNRRLALTFWVTATSGPGIFPFTAHHHLFDIETGQEVQQLEGFASTVRSNMISAVFSPDGLWVLTAGGTPSLWNAATGEEMRRFEGFASEVHSVAISPDGSWIVTALADHTSRLWNTTTGKEVQVLRRQESFQQRVIFSPDSRFVLTGGGNSPAQLWDVTTGQEVRQFVETGWVGPVVFSPNGRFVLTGNSHGARLWNATTGEEVRQFEHDGHAVESLAFSPDGKFIVTGAWNLSASLWDVATGQQVRGFGESWQSDTVAFSPDGRFILRGNRFQEAYLWDVATGQEIRRFQASHVDSMVFSPDGRLVLLDEELWDVATGQKVRRFEGHVDSITSGAFSPDGRFVLTGSLDNTARLWDVATGRELCQLITLRDGTWVVVDSEGRFDTNNLDNNPGLHWVMPDDPFTPLPLEIFMRDYYEPRLLPRILAGEKFRPVRALQDLNRVQPTVQITKIDSQANAPDTVMVTVEATKAAREFQRGDKQVRVETGVYDLRLFRDGQLVGYTPESAGEIVRDSQTGAAVRTFTVKLPRSADKKKVEFSAYAFNVDRIKSATDRKTFSVPTSVKPVKGRAYLITVGVNAYENPAWDLRFAANDARQLARTLHTRLAGTRAYDDIISITLVSDSDRENNKRVTTESYATKRNVQTVLALLAGKEVLPEQRKELLGAETIHPARPEDLVLLSVSSHGYADLNGLFYLFPFDIGPGQEKVVTPELLRHAISSDDLSRWLRDVDAGEIVLIVDACHSAASVEGEGFKPGPMGSRGLGQLAYDKGMRILTASQADDVAIESNLLQQGLLTYALIQDGLEAGQADFHPRDRTITLTEWLCYGAERVPQLYVEVRSGQLQQVGRSEQSRAAVVEYAPQSSSLKRQGFQQPALFDFARRQGDTILTRERPKQ